MGMNWRCRALLVTVDELLEEVSNCQLYGQDGGPVGAVQRAAGLPGPWSKGLVLGLRW
jgi:hypothetical protein